MAGMQKLAIDSLSAYASAAHAFVIVAPPVTHSELAITCDVESYNTRMWCRAENLCHSVHRASPRTAAARDRALAHRPPPVLSLC